jgi:hypothetical protein
MLTRLLPILHIGARQIVPPVIATIIAALLIAGYNRAFSGHLMQPRMAAIQGKIGVPDEVAPPPAVKLHEPTDAIAVVEPAVPQRIFAKDDDREAAKDGAPFKIATAPASLPAAAPAAPAPVAAAPQHAAAPAAAPPAAPAPRNVARKIEPRVIEQRPMMVATAPAAPVVQMPQPVVVQAAPMAQSPMIVQSAPAAAPYPQPVAQEPPPVIAAKPMVTVPSRPGAPADPQVAGQEFIPPPPQGGPLERFVDTFKPSSIFARMREFGDRIEAAGNDILPNIRQ